MDSLLLVLGLVCMLTGLAGSILPILPGTPLSWLGLLLLHFTSVIKMNYWLLGVTLLITIMVGILDYTLPAKGARHFGGSKYGIWGTNIGLFIGIVAPIPFGFLIGPFVGAFIGELIYNSNNHKQALRAATGAFLGFISSSFMKFMVCLIYFGLFLVVVWKNRAGLF